MSEQVEKNPMKAVFEIRDFKLLFSAVSASLLGDQFVLIATPWLVLQLTGDPLVLGIVLALEGAPRAVFMLIGGAITDRLSPRFILLVADIIRAVLAGVMALMVFSGTIEIWMLYGFGLAFGLVAGFAVPAGNSIVPMLVQEKYLQAGNSLVMGIGQIAGFAGPVMAGILIGHFADSLFGVGLAFGIDAITFVVSGLLLFMMKGGGSLDGKGADEEKQSVWDAIKIGVRYVWDDPALRLMFLIIAGVNFLFVGPILVGIPVLADQRLAEGAFAFGLLMSGFAGGNLGGYLLAGLLPRPQGKTMAVFLVVFLLSFGCVTALIGLINMTWVDFALMVALGLGNGYTTIILFTSIQVRAPKDMMGRIMSLLALASFGLVPVSQALSGVVISWNLTALFVLSGILIFLGTIWAALQPALPDLVQNLVTEPDSDAPAG